MTKSEQLLAMLAGRRGHFEMESGYHSEAWFELDRLFDDEARLRPFVRELAQRLAAHDIQAICGPETGGAKLAALIAQEWGRAAFAAARVVASDAQGLFPIKYQLPAAAREQLRGVRTAIVDDAISAGSAVRGTLADLLDGGARPVAIGALITFGDAAASFARENRLAYETIARTPLAMWKPEKCPLCAAGLRLERVSDAARSR